MMIGWKEENHTKITKETKTQRKREEEVFVRNLRMLVSRNDCKQKSPSPIFLCDLLFLCVFVRGLSE
jgi:hypothetical protein